MQICVKKVYCPNDQRLVGCREEKTGKNTRVVCAKCGTLLYTWNGVTWVRPRETA